MLHMKNSAMAPFRSLLQPLQRAPDGRAHLRADGLPDGRALLGPDVRPDRAALPPIVGPDGRTDTITIYGIDRLDDADAWQNATAGHIAAYFEDEEEDADDAGVYSVDALVLVTGQESSNADLFQRRELRGGGADSPPPTGGRRDATGIGAGDERRSLQSAFVKVTYDQTSTWGTDDPGTYDALYVATTGTRRRRTSPRFGRSRRSTRR